MRQARQGGGLVEQELAARDLLGCVQGCCTWSRGKKVVSNGMEDEHRRHGQATGHQVGT